MIDAFGVDREIISKVGPTPEGAKMITAVARGGSIKATKRPMSPKQAARETKVLLNMERYAKDAAEKGKKVPVYESMTPREIKDSARAGFPSKFGNIFTSRNAKGSAQHIQRNVDAARAARARDIKSGKSWF